MLSWRWFLMSHLLSHLLSCRQNGEAQLHAFVKSSAKREKMGLERLLLMEGAVREVASASQNSVAEMQVCLGLDNNLFLTPHAPHTQHNSQYHPLMTCSDQDLAS